MGDKPSFSTEIANLLYANGGRAFNTCIQCGTCSATCPVEKYMDYSPREIIAMIRAGLKKDVLTTNTFWFCASCYHCSVRCPRDIKITDMMYALKRYSIWKKEYRDEMIGPDFSRRFTKAIIKGGKSFEPSLAPAFIFKNGIRGLVNETETALTLFRKGRLPLTPTKIKRIKNFQRMLNRIIPMGGES